MAHIDAENRRQTLEEELEFLKQVHEQVSKCARVCVYVCVCVVQNWWQKCEKAYVSK